MSLCLAVSLPLIVEQLRSRPSLPEGQEHWQGEKKKLLSLGISA